jgi:hypothetical protein
MTPQPTVTMNLTAEQSAAINHWIAHEYGPDRMDVLDQVFVRQLLVEYASRPLEEILRPGETPEEFEARCNETIAWARELGIFMAMYRAGFSPELVQELVRASEERIGQERGA